MGAIAAKMTGLGQMRSDIDSLKEKMGMIENLTKKLEDAGKELTSKAEGAMKMKTELESKIGGITGNLDQINKLNSGLGGQLGNVEGLIKKVSGGGFM